MRPEEGHPLKQGLKLVHGGVVHDGRVPEEGHPLKQGLKPKAQREAVELGALKRDIH